MQDQNDKAKTGRYCFRGRVFESDETTVTVLNHALALNRCDDRYIKVSDDTPLTQLDKYGDVIEK